MWGRYRDRINMLVGVPSVRWSSEEHGPLLHFLGDRTPLT